VTFVVVTGLPDLPEQTADPVLPELTANPAPPEAMVPPVLRALKALMASQAPMELLVDAAPTAHRVLKVRPALRGLKVDLKAAKAMDRTVNLKDPCDSASWKRPRPLRTTARESGGNRWPFETGAQRACERS
jgi:hypothetical protein